MVALNEPAGASVGYEKKGYARGLILGLTMAETMLLLVFCLLLVAGAIVAKKKAELETALEKVSRGQRSDNSSRRTKTYWPGCRALGTVHWAQGA
ncbi:hypothetical protein [Mesorhizobium sp.]|uniref:hypothetical protein n=1 Tax=Mesorhizobium sp. TaxID=1871066 RepID=UPI0025BC81D4|nr:hypothetical protein [Mesorhizobium sp.]